MVNGLQSLPLRGAIQGVLEVGVALEGGEVQVALMGAGMKVPTVDGRVKATASIRGEEIARLQARREEVDIQEGEWSDGVWRKPRKRWGWGFKEGRLQMKGLRGLSRGKVLLWMTAKGWDGIREALGLRSPFYSIFLGYKLTYFTN